MRPPLQTSSSGVLVRGREEPAREHLGLTSELRVALGLQGAERLLKVFQRSAEGGAQPSTSLPPHREARAGQAPREETVSLALCPRCSS